MTDFGSEVTIIIVFAILNQFCVDRVKELVGERAYHPNPQEYMTCLQN